MASIRNTTENAEVEPALEVTRGDRIQKSRITNRTDSTDHRKKMRKDIRPPF